MSTLSSTTGREVAAGTLWMTKGENTKVGCRNIKYFIYYTAFAEESQGGCALWYT